MISLRRQIQLFLVWLMSAVGMAWSLGAQAQEMNLANAPLFLGSTIEPNVFFELDDSGSMDWETLTFDYHYYRAYWEDTNMQIMKSGVWENRIDADVDDDDDGYWQCYYYWCTWVSGGGGGGGDVTDDDDDSDRREILYMYKNNDRLYTSTNSYTTPQDQEQLFDRDWRGRSVDFNLLYYDPSVNYEPWDSGLADSNFSSARSNGVPGQDGYYMSRDLDDSGFEVWIDDHGFGGSRPNGPDDATDGANGVVDIWDSHTLYVFDDDNDELDWIHYEVPNAASMAALNQECTLGHAIDEDDPFKDCFGTEVTTGSYDSNDINPWGRTFEEEKQNFANWYTYYRKRSYVAKGAIARVINITDNFRYGLGLINEYDDVWVEVPDGDATTFPGHNADLLEELFDYEWRARGTPLRTGLQRVGQYFDNTIWGYADPIISECQQNFAILISDGFWSSSPNPSNYIGDADGDGHSRTVADVAKYYYEDDLSPLANNVPTSVLDPNNKQHLVTFTVNFGLRGALEDTDNDGFPNPELEEDDDWGNPYSSNIGIQNQGRIDDMWHAAFNSKGWYIQAQAPDDLVKAISDALSDITDRVGSSASVATNSGSLNSESHLYQARFDSGGWSGQLRASRIQNDGSVSPTLSWEASDVLDTMNYDVDRSIITMNTATGNGVPFRWPANYRLPFGAALSTGQINSLLTNGPYPPATILPGQISANQNFGQDIVDYLRGDRSNEATAPRSFRERNSALGDIVDSDPKFVGPPRFRYPDAVSFAPKPYSDYVSANANRTKVVYVGANDGMLHGFEEDTGEELIAYIPTKSFENLHQLADPLYSHRYFVNEAPTIVDAFFTNTLDPISGTNGAWRTILAGGMGHGGQGVYALDVSDPDNFSEANAGNIVLWEFTDDDDDDLGYTYGEVQMAKMQNGDWAAVFSNGYNNTESDGDTSSTGHAVLYIVNLETGNLIKKIDTEAGSAGTPNGLATPALIDTDGDMTADTIYAGDLLGNVWKFDVSSNNTADWDVAYQSGGNPAPFFETGAGRPITTPIQVTFHPEGRDGYMLYFGTGQYLEPSDNSVYAQPTQAFYGLWDKDEAIFTAFDHSDLLEQEITNQYLEGYDTDDDNVDDNFELQRESTDTPIDYDTKMGWYIQLIPNQIEGVNNNNNFGEKQVSRAIVEQGSVIFTTVLPSAGACDFGGSSYTMILDYTNGGPLDYPSFDVNGDDSFDDSDPIISGLGSDGGILNTLGIIVDTQANQTNAYGSSSTGNVEELTLNLGNSALGRQSWRELR